MLIGVVTKTHGPRLHRPDHHKGRPGHRVVTTIDALLTRSPLLPGLLASPPAAPPNKIIPRISRDDRDCYGITGLREVLTLGITRCSVARIDERLQAVTVPERSRRTVGLFQFPRLRAV